MLRKMSEKENMSSDLDSLVAIFERKITCAKRKKKNKQKNSMYKKEKHQTKCVTNIPGLGLVFFVHFYNRISIFWIKN